MSGPIKLANRRWKTSSPSSVLKSSLEQAEQMSDVIVVSRRVDGSLHYHSSDTEIFAAVGLLENVKLALALEQSGSTEGAEDPAP